MPRQYLQLSNFSGGLNTQFDQRDIAGNELTDASNVQVYKSGQIYSSRVSTTVTTRGSGSLTDGKGLFLFKADNNFSDVNDSVEILALADISSSQVDFIEDPFGTPDNTNHLGTIDLGTETTNGNFVYYYVDGALRISDCYRSGATLNESNRTKWFGHVDRVGTIPGAAVDDWVTASNNLAAPSAGDVTTTGSAKYASAGAGFDVDVTVETTDDDGLWEATTYEFAQSFVYEGDQESLLTEYSGNVALSTNNYFTGVIVGVETDDTDFAQRIKGGRVYIRKKDSNDLWTLFLDMDWERGVRKDFGDTFTVWNEDESNKWRNTAALEMKGPSIDTYESINGFSPDVGHLSFGEADGLSYKDATVCNMRTFVAHVNYYTSIGGTETKLMPDRILYTPIGKYDTFPPNQFIDIGINDGEDFTALESFGTKILAFKQSTLYIIDVTSPDDVSWFLESTHKGVGVDKPTAVVRTEFGICWANTNGVYLWSPSQGISNLSIKLDKDFAPLSGMANPVIGFYPPKGHLLIVQDCTQSSDMLVYDFNTKSFTKLASYTAAKITNMQNNVNECIWLEGDTDSETVKKYSPTQGTTNIAFSFTTKDFDFGNPALTKKIKKIIVSYSTGIGLDSVSSDTGVITAVTQANPAVVTSASHGLSNGQVVRIDGVVGMTEINDTLFTTANVATDTFQLSGENSSGYTAYSSGGTWAKATAGVAVTTTYFTNGDTDATGSFSPTWATAAQNGIINIDASAIGAVSSLRLKFSATGCYKINDITVVYRTRMKPPATSANS
jgi:hypothetical protein